MSRMVIVTQFFLPVLLLLWLALFPAAGLLALGLQAFSVAAIILGIGLAALWAMPPFWVPYLYGVLFLGILAWHLLKGHFLGKGLWRASAGPTTLAVRRIGFNAQ